MCSTSCTATTSRRRLSLRATTPTRFTWVKRKKKGREREQESDLGGKEVEVKVKVEVEVERERAVLLLLSPLPLFSFETKTKNLLPISPSHVPCALFFFYFVADCFRNISKTRALASMGCESRASIARAASTLVTPCATSKLAASSNQTLFS